MMKNTFGLVYLVLLAFYVRVRGSQDNLATSHVDASPYQYNIQEIYDAMPEFPQFRTDLEGPQGDYDSELDDAVSTYDSPHGMESSDSVNHPALSENAAPPFEDIAEVTTSVDGDVTDIEVTTSSGEDVAEIDVTASSGEYVTDIEVTGLPAEGLTYSEVTTPSVEYVTDNDVAASSDEDVTDNEVTATPDEYVTENDVTASSDEDVTDSEVTATPDEDATVVTTRAQDPIPQSTAEIANERILKDMISNPKARLYSEENLSGSYEDYSFEKATYGMGCHNLSSLIGRVKSVDTFGKCVRLFRARNCEGWSEAVYPGSGTSHNVTNSKLTKITSVGPCLPDEFQSVSLLDESSGLVVKNTFDVQNNVPDLVEFLSHDKYWQAIGDENSLKYYSPKGPHNRSEFLLAHVYRKHLRMSTRTIPHPRMRVRDLEEVSGELDEYLSGRSEAVYATRIEHRHLNATQPSVNMADTLFYRSLDKHEGDVVGFGIPLDLGGPVTEKNIFPQSPAGKDKWLEVTSGIRPYLEQHMMTGFVDVGLNFMYASNATTRPYAFYYWIKFGTDKILYGRVLN